MNHQGPRRFRVILKHGLEGMIMYMRNKLFAPLLLAAAAPALIFAFMPAPAVAADPVYRVGFEQAAIPDPGHAPISAIIWYPTTAEARDAQLGPVAIKAAPGHLARDRRGGDQSHRHCDGAGRGRVHRRDTHAQRRQFSGRKQCRQAGLVRRPLSPCRARGRLHDR